MRRCVFRIALAIATIVAAAFAEARAAAPTTRTVAPSPTITAFPLNTPPVNGFIPRVAFGLTSEQDNNDFTYQAHPKTNPGGTQYPAVGGPAYFVATFDTGAQSHIVSYAAAEVFNLAGPPNREGTYQAEILGASGSEFADISDGLGIYMTGLGNARGGSSISVTPGTLSGQYNTAILTTDSSSSLPNIIGAPMAAQYQTVIRTSVPRTLTVGDTTYHSPDVSFQPRDTPFPANYSRLTLEAMSPVGTSPEPVFIPEFSLSPANNPTTPTFWMSLHANVTASDTGGTASNRQFMFDTGAQVTVLSQDVAAEVGFYSAGENPSTPAFFVEVSGVGGSQQVPGFYLDSLRVVTNGGPLVWNNVPVLVLDVIDPRDGSGFAPGILGMNLFTDRDLIINGGLTNPSVAISPQQQWAANASGNWSDAAKWVGGVPEHISRVANFLTRITSPQTVTVNADYTLNSINFDNAHRYTLSGAGRLTLDSVEGAAGITVANGNHTINAPLTFAADTAIWVLPAASKLTINGDVIATGIAITKNGAGTVEMKNVRTDSLVLDGGTVAILPSGANAATSIVKSISATNGQLDLQNNKLIVRGAAGGGTGELGAWNGSAYTGVTGLVADDHLITSQSNASAANLRTTLGVATADQINRVGQSFGGQTVLTGDVLVMYTWAGDANLSGVIDGDDFFRIDSGFSGNLKGYFNGDFDYSGKIDADDYWLIDRNYAAGGSLIASAVSAVPEPAGISLVLAAFALITRGRRV